jgi:predicted RNA-binding Zn ribbon-like protein
MSCQQTEDEMTSSPMEGLEVLRSFVNTVDLEKDTDQVGTPERLRGWLVEHTLLAEDMTVDDHDHRQALEFREALRALALANRGSAEGDEAAVNALNRLGAGASFSVVLRAKGDAQLRPSGAGIDHALGHLLAILYRAIVDGSFVRLKGCANETCRWVYYDRSKNRSRKWCEMETCGNMINARAYRQRRHHEAADQSQQAET